MFFLGDAHVSSIHTTRFPFGQRIAFAGFSKNRADWYHALEELEFTASQVIKAGERDAHVSEKMMRAFKPAEKKFYAACLKLAKTNLAKITNFELLKKYDELADIYTQKLNASPLIDGFALTTDKTLALEIHAALKKAGEENDFVPHFAALTAPTFLSFLQLEEVELLKVALQIKKNPKREKELLEKHRQQFFWIQNNYVKDHQLPVSFFEKRLHEFEKMNCNHKILEINNIPIHNKKRKQELIKRFGISNALQTLLKITDDFNYWQDERKKGTFWATHYFSLLLEEFARRTGYSLSELKYAFPPEMKAVLEKKLDAKELRKRFEYCMLVWVPESFDVITDLKLILELDAIGTGKSHVVHELSGFTASLGKARGTVRIVESVEEIGKVQNGDILIAVMTRPDYLPAMKRAAAFVTDEGGVTCHAAIVAREMHKPCVIGTKIATKTFKDGETVEVDAEKGIVRKI